MKRPASQYYWGDWLKNTALQSCPLAVRGLWHEMNCIMHQCEPYGHLYRNGKPMTSGQLAKLVRISDRECSKYLAELEDAGMFSRDPEGAIYCRRMVRDEELRNARAAGGALGAEYGIKGAEAGRKGGRPRKEIGGFKTPLHEEQIPPPSCSSSPSSSGREENPSGSVVSAAPEPTKSLAPTIPCPYERIVDAYHRELPTLPKIILRDGATWNARQKAMRVFWGWVLASRKSDGMRRAETAEQALDWIAGYFGRARDNDFVMGRSAPGAGHSNWRADFDYLLSPKGQRQVIEKTLENAA